DVAVVCGGVPGDGECFRRAAVGSHPALFPNGRAGALPASARVYGNFGGILDPRAGNDYRTRAPRGYRVGGGGGGGMSKISRRQLIAVGAVTAAGASGLAVAAKLAHRYGLVPPDSGGIYGPGATLTYAAQRLLARHSMAREFSRNQISAKPLQNE